MPEQTGYELLYQILNDVADAIRTKVQKLDFSTFNKFNEFLYKETDCTMTENSFNTILSSVLSAPTTYPIVCAICLDYSSGTNYHYQLLVFFNSNSGEIFDPDKLIITEDNSGVTIYNNTGIKLDYRFGYSSDSKEITNGNGYNQGPLWPNNSVFKQRGSNAGRMVVSKFSNDISNSPINAQDFSTLIRSI